MAVFIPRFLRHLRDVDETGVADGDSLTYDSGTETWVPAAGGGGGGPPTGAAGGVLGGTYPNPGFAADMVTQAELDAIAAGAVILAPASSARNVIQPTAGAVVAAIVKAHAAQSVDLTQWQTSAGAVLASIGESGAWLLQPSDDTLSTLAEIIGPAGFSANSPSGLLLALVDESGTHIADFDTYGGVILTSPLGSGSGLLTLQSLDFATDELLLSSGSNSFTLNRIAVRVGGVLKYRIAGDGSVISAVNAALADASLVAGEIQPWFDPTNGAAKYMLKGRTLDGTVVTWEFANGVYSPGGSGAPTTATYITQTPDAGLSAEQALSALATGLVKNTTGTGVLSIGAQGTDYYAPGGTDVAVADGGTGSSTAAGARTNLDVPSNAEAVLDSLFDANTVLAADADNTPAALTMGASTILARLAAGNIKAATPAEIITLLAGVPRVIASGTVTGAAVANIDITGIAATYSKLELVLYLRGTTAAATVNCLLRFNGDTGGNYDFERKWADSGSTGQAGSFAQTSMTIAPPVAASAPANAFSPIKVVIPAYAQTVGHKGALTEMFGRYGVSSCTLEQWGGSWRSTAAINQITLTPSAGNWEIGSSWQLIGT